MHLERKSELLCDSVPSSMFVLPHLLCVVVVARLLRPQKELVVFGVIN